jgi:hypothetical protein
MENHMRAYTQMLQQELPNLPTGYNEPYFDDKTYMVFVHKLMEQGNQQAIQECVEDTVLCRNDMYRLFSSNKGDDPDDVPSRNVLDNLPDVTKKTLSPVFENLVTRAIDREFDFKGGSDTIEISKRTVKLLAYMAQGNEALGKEFIEKIILDKDSKADIDMKHALAKSYIQTFDTTTPDPFTHKNFWDGVDYEAQPYMAGIRYMAYDAKDPAEALRSFHVLKEKPEMYNDEEKQNGFSCGLLFAIDDTLQNNENNQECIRAIKEMPLWIKELLLRSEMKYEGGFITNQLKDDPEVKSYIEQLKLQVR